MNARQRRTLRRRWSRLAGRPLTQAEAQYAESSLRIWAASEGRVRTGCPTGLDLMALRRFKSGVAFALETVGFRPAAPCPVTWRRV